MNILIENNDTLEYLTPGGGWTKNPLNGKSFKDARMAFRAAKLEAIGKFNIVSHIPETNQFINLDHGRGMGLPVVAGQTPAGPSNA
ncbi:MAG TPA: hypothetical protein VMF08_01635 [Candidatus Sulfotelmatobacter sp.]|nr:hypothetical protein [Candidatus Sulfotelmatobacter sp.]